MKISSSSSLFLFISSIALAIIVAASATSLVDTRPWAMAASLGGGPCRGSIAECMVAEAEDEMDSEVNRRILATTQYISYGALRRNTVPCSQRGASYYNCQAGAQANPYTRGCTAITQYRG